MTTIEDDRTEEQMLTHRWLVIGTDSFMSGWGGADSGASYAAWACKDEAEANVVEARIEARPEMKRVRVVYELLDARYRPSRGCAHLHIYVNREG